MATIYKTAIPSQHPTQLSLLQLPRTSKLQTSALQPQNQPIPATPASKERQLIKANENEGAGRSRQQGQNAESDTPMRLGTGK
ncbi:hypothetical protein P170DRAFT_436219 [Aspergillus steynii IBT 23096]|uniref:Uncharacterized protein n=1 Tax=Aspergillus steynii IBT 23096 TaxID=1392250 RepID=A0A2I2GE49_9EURO|nr:uncharacterized protein P170DRAFT_436219 [Aspergillus steynii IBT 23096]PLB51143.1 hypothetical protein P170DRAFT_436219 [Aspergillus steynii IBT 23096]